MVVPHYIDTNRIRWWPFVTSVDSVAADSAVAGWVAVVGVAVVSSVDNVFGWQYLAAQ